MKNTPVGDWLNAQDVEFSNGKKSVRVDGDRWHLLTKTHLGRLFREVNGAAKAIEGATPLRNWLLEFATGVKTYEIDLGLQQTYLEYDAQMTARAYKKALNIGDKVAADRLLEKIRAK
jgi:hypothetical protein